MTVVIATISESDWCKSDKQIIIYSLVTGINRLVESGRLFWVCLLLIFYHFHGDFREILKKNSKFGGVCHVSTSNAWSAGRTHVHTFLCSVYHTSLQHTLQRVLWTLTYSHRARLGLRCTHRNLPELNRSPGRRALPGTPPESYSAQSKTF